MEFKPSIYQQNIKTWFDARDGKHLIVQAPAGSGKTRTGVWLIENMTEIEKHGTIFVAFNKDIAVVLRQKLAPIGAVGSTYHSLGLKSIKKTYPNAKVVDGGYDKSFAILKNMLGANEKWMMPSISKLIGMCKNLLIMNPTSSDLYDLSLEYDVELFDKEDNIARDRIFEVTPRALAISRDRTDLIDYDDMPSMPITDDHISPIQYDTLLVDEVQDTNLAQSFLAINSVTDGGTIMGIGDRRQSIYAFRGATSGAMEQFRQELNAEELPLSISYRCPTLVRDYVNKEFPDIAFETPEWAIEGTIDTISKEKIHETIVEDDMVLCRINAELVPVAFSLIRKGIKATIKGKDIGKSLVTLIKKQRADDVPDLFYNLEEFREKQYAKFLKLDKVGKIAQLDDQIATLDVMSEGANSVAELITRCETLFSDERSAVTLSTIHKAKGLEAKNVYILRPDLLPHPMAKKPEHIAQESNLKYVAVTRTQEKLVWVV